MGNSIVVHRPEGKVTHLVLLFHGVGSSAADMTAIGNYAARTLSEAMVVSVDAVHPSDFGHGRQWFSVQGVTETNRIERVAEAMQAFIDTILHWQQQADITAENTILIGFSQGAIMSLEATQFNERTAGKIIAIAGRFAQPPRTKPNVTKVYLLHGDQDKVIAVDYSKQATESFQHFDVPVVLNIFPDLGHGVDARVIARLVEHLGE